MRYGRMLGYRTSRVLEQAGGYIEQISANLTTQYIGQFPTFMPKIVEALAEAQDTISIATDFPGYGIFSNHEQYIAYKTAIERKVLDELEITMVVLNKKERRRLHAIQFRDMTLEELQNPNNASFDNFLRWSRRERGEIRDMKDFATALGEEQTRALKQDFRGVNRKEFSGNMPLYIWIVDDKIAVFSIPALAGGAREGAFLTRDHRLISELHTIFKNYAAASSPVSP